MESQQNTGIVHYENEEHFKALLQQASELKVPVFVKWSADWCQPCKIIAPEFERLAKLNKDKAYFASLDYDTLEDVAKDGQVKSLPTFWKIVDKNIVDIMSGANKERLGNFVFQK
jgi:thioredoxin-like negative regulator of GroEL